MNHLGMRRGFDNTVGSFQTGGAYSGPKHSMRWQNDHPIWVDQYFDNKPAGCVGETSEPFAFWLDGSENAAAQCDHTSSNENWLVVAILLAAQSAERSEMLELVALVVSLAAEEPPSG